VAEPDADPSAGKTSGEAITIQIDANPILTAKTETDEKRNFLIVPLANTSASVMTAFLRQLAAGHKMHWALL
jgi:hypothetical protein